MDRFFTLSSDLFLVAGFDGCFKSINGAWETTLGYDIKELLGKPYIGFVHPDDREATRAEATKLVKGGETIQFENRYRRKDGAYVWFSWSAKPFLEEKALYCVARDVTERNRAEEALHAAYDEMEARVNERTAELAKANEAIRELSTPVLPVSQGLLIVPMIGAIDPQRARQLTEQLLRSIRQNRAKVAVLDVTGVSTIDTAVANHLIQTAQAAKLLGATVILTGVSRGIAQTLVQIGVDLGQITTMGDLQSGIEEAYQILHRRLVPTE